jgi:hypothetical protein
MYSDIKDQVSLFLSLIFLKVGVDFFLTAL